MESPYDISQYTEYSEALIALESDDGFKTQEISLVQTLSYLSSRYFDKVSSIDVFNL